MFWRPYFCNRYLRLLFLPTADIDCVYYASALGLPLSYPVSDRIIVVDTGRGPDVDWLGFRGRYAVTTAAWKATWGRG